MASSSGTSSGSSAIQNSGSDEDLLALMDQRKRKRMISNRESARRSRMRKQKHLDDLMSQVDQLRKDNHQIISNISITTQHFITIEAENSVLRAQVDELTHRLQSLNDIISFMNTTTPSFDQDTYSSFMTTADHHHQPVMVDNNFLMNNPLNLSYLYQQPIMASADHHMFQY
ncbi:hypothetical protein Dsin_026745 [Dipteronia sinensis]|uniref:BZIP domain-containing protein n=1 Tax=Dipteronia sinensis TaxID=43782 RepID=A0AAE0DY38_9ROSI|nr:hypothetical protein Dsin_026745 [Dipteronia sinensis]